MDATEGPFVGIGQASQGPLRQEIPTSAVGQDVSDNDP